MAGTARGHAEFCEIYEELDGEAFLWDAPVEGAAECLDELAAAGLQLGVVSNADGRIGQALERAGLASWIVDHRGTHVLEHPRRVRSLREFSELALAALAGRGPSR